MKSDDPDDPKGLIAESFRIEAITEAECRSIFLDWALSLPDGSDSREVARAVLAKLPDRDLDHPMRRVLAEALEPSSAKGRRGGARGRRR